MSEAKNLFITILNRQLKEYTKKDIDIAALPLDTKLEELELDSLTYLEAINELEDELGIEVPFSSNTSEPLETVGDLLKIADKLI